MNFDQNSIIIKGIFFSFPKAFSQLIIKKTFFLYLPPSTKGSLASLACWCLRGRSNKAWVGVRGGLGFRGPFGVITTTPSSSSSSSSLSPSFIFHHHFNDDHHHHRQYHHGIIYLGFNIKVTHSQTTLTLFSFPSTLDKKSDNDLWSNIITLHVYTQISILCLHKFVLPSGLIHLLKDTTMSFTLVLPQVNTCSENIYIYRPFQF